MKLKDSTSYKSNIILSSYKDKNDLVFIASIEGTYIDSANNYNIMYRLIFQLDNNGLSTIAFLNCQNIWDFLHIYVKKDMRNEYYFISSDKVSLYISKKTMLYKYLNNKKTFRLGEELLKAYLLSLPYETIKINK